MSCEHGILRADREYLELANVTLVAATPVGVLCGDLNETAVCFWTLGQKWVAMWKNATVRRLRTVMLGNFEIHYSIHCN